MNIDLTQFNLANVDYIDIDEVYSFSKKELENTDIISLDNVKVTGDITKNSMDEYIINVDINGKMVLPCAITLKPVDYKFMTHVDGNIEELLEEIGEKLEKGQKTLDILPIIWENILMEIPIRVVSDDIDDIQTKGEGWELVTDDVSGKSV